MKKPSSKKLTEVNSLSRASAAFFWSTVILFQFVSFKSMGQDSSQVDKRKLRTITIASGIGYAGGLVALNEVWYKDGGRGSFQFFNDWAEWKQLDKTGHFFTAFYLSEATSSILQSCGVRPGRSHVTGAITGFLLTVPIEIMDGFAKGYGASPGDLVADAAGPLFFLGQQLAWNEVRIRPKYSFQRTSYAPLRPSLLGNGFVNELVKDYNGHTFWLSVDVDKFVTFPKWLNFAIGYGAEGMIYARDAQNVEAGFNPYRQYYVGLDIDLSSIRTRSKWVKTGLFLLNMVRLPAPAVMLSSNGSKFYPFYF